MNGWLLLLAVTVAALLGPPPATATPVSLRHGGVELTGDFREVSPGGVADGVILLLHGTLAHHRMEVIETLQTLFAERGRNTLAITLSLGVPARSGMYECSTPHRHRLSDALDEIDAWMAWLSQRGARSVTLLGHSLGGNQAARYAIDRAGAPLKALVLVAPSTDDAARRRDRYLSRGGMSLDAVIARARGAGPHTWLDNVQFLHCGPSRVTAGSFLSYYQDDGLRDTATLLPRITVPTLVIAGSADTTVPDVAPRTRAQKDADTELVVVEGADHFFRDLYAEDVADAVTTFVGD